MTKPRIGFIGVGNMGTPMSRRIHEHGYPLTIFDADRKKAVAHASEIGCETAGSPAELGSQCEVVVTMLPDGHIVRDVILGEDGVASTLEPGALVIDMSSSAPAGTRELGAALAERGIDLVDAPVSGGIGGAEAGTLSIMIGADSDAARERATPILETMGSKLFTAGPLGAGHAAKALNNLLGGLNLVGTAEVLLISRQFGLDPSTIFTIINESTGRSLSTAMMAQRWPDISTPVGFGLSLMAKDVSLARGMAEQMVLKTPLASAVDAILADACEQLGPADSIAIHRYLSMLNDLEEGGNA